MEDWRNESYTPEKCLECKLHRLCSGGCRADAEARGNIKGMDVNAVPENVEFYKFPEPKEIKYSFGSSDKFYINPDILFRAESFGGIIYIKNTTNYLNINKLAFSYLKEYSKDSITYDEFLGASNAKKEDECFVKNLFEKLVIKQFILRK